MTATRRSVLVLPLALAGLGIRAQAAELPAPASLQAELAAALAARKPLVVMASLHGCPFCKIVRDNFLAPLRADTGQPIVQLDTQSSQAVLDFAGKPSTHDRMLKALGVTVLPTVMFFGKGGREVAERLVGASIPDFYGAYLDDRLRKAGASIV